MKKILFLIMCMLCVSINNINAQQSKDNRCEYVNHKNHRCINYKYKNFDYCKKHLISTKDSTYQSLVYNKTHQSEFNVLAKSSEYLQKSSKYKYMAIGFGVVGAGFGVLTPTCLSEKKLNDPTLEIVGYSLAGGCVVTAIVFEFMSIDCINKAGINLKIHPNSLNLSYNF